MVRLLRMGGEPEVLRPEQLEALIPRLRETCSSFPVVLLYLHGSYASGRQTALSDIDVGVLFETERARDRQLHLDLLTALQAILGREDVDLVVFNTAGPIIADRVVRHGRLVYCQGERERILFEAAAVKAALDFRHFSRIYDDALFARLSEGRFLD